MIYSNGIIDNNAVGLSVNLISIDIMIYYLYAVLIHNADTIVYFDTIGIVLFELIGVCYVRIVRDDVPFCLTARYRYDDDN